MTNKENKVDYEKMASELMEAVGTEIKYKDESRIMKIIGWLVRPFNKRWMTDYASVIFNKIWLPDRKHRENMDKRFLLTWLAHECSHVDSYNKQGVFGMVFSYGLPASLALVLVPVSIALFVMYGLGVDTGFSGKEVLASAIVTISLAVLSLVPWPSYFRIREECLAEACETKVREALGFAPEHERLLENATSWEYYNPMFKLSWAKKIYAKRLEEINERLKSPKEKDSYGKALAKVTSLISNN